MRQFAVFIGFIALSGCAEYQQRQAEQRQYQEWAAQDNADQKCRSYGVAPGSTGYVQCRMNLDNQAAADDQQRRALAASILLKH